MDRTKLIEILRQAGKLKEHTRHCWIDADRKESVADHSFRTALMVMLLQSEPEFRDADLNKVIRMCLIHDLGESFTGDIPCFEKTEGQERSEDTAYDNWVEHFPEPARSEWRALRNEMTSLETKEARIYKALDKLEALISHNESDLATWLPLEYDLQLTYGTENVAFSPYLTKLKATIDAWTRRKIYEAGDAADHFPS